MKRFSDRHALHTLSELNITPLLDLAFVLLIIFMITTPLMEKSVDVVLPSSKTASGPVDPALVQNVAVQKDAQISMNGEPVDLGQLEERLVAAREAKPDAAVVIRSHKELPVQRLVEVMDAVQRAKIARVGVVTQPDAP